MRLKLLFLFTCTLLALYGYANGSPANNSVGGDMSLLETHSHAYEARVVDWYYDVRSGDTLFRIALENGVSVEDIMNWNDMESSRIYAGAKLKLHKTELFLKEPEVLEIAFDEKSATGIMDEYVAEIGNEVASETNKEIIEEQMTLLADENLEYLKAIPYTKKNNNIWSRISGSANVAFTSVKDWGKSLVGKDGDKYQTEILYAENTEVSSETYYADEIDIAENSYATISDSRVYTVQISEEKIIMPQGDMIAQNNSEKKEKGFFRKVKKTWSDVSKVASNTFNSVKSVVDKRGEQEAESKMLSIEDIYLSLNETPITDAAIYENGTHNPIYPGLHDFKKVYHKVRIGETMVQIASRYNVSKTDIVRWNKLPSGIVNVKQRLLLFVPKDFNLAQNQVKKKGQNI